MHVSSRTISILPRVDEKNISTHTSEATQGSEACWTTSHDDGIVLCLRHGRDISSSNGSSIAQRDEGRGDESGKEPHFSDQVIGRRGWVSDEGEKMKFAVMGSYLYTRLPPSAITTAATNDT